MVRFYFFIIFAVILPLFAVGLFSLPQIQAQETAESQEKAQEKLEDSLGTVTDIAEAQKADIANLKNDFQTFDKDLEKLSGQIKQLQKTLRSDLSPKELATIRKKQSKDIAQIILRFQDRIAFLERQNSDLTGQLDNFISDQDSIEKSIEAIRESLANLIENYTGFTEGSTSRQENLRVLLLEQTRILQMQQKIIKTQALAIKRLNTKHNGLVKKIQKASEDSKINLGVAVTNKKPTTKTSKSKTTQTTDKKTPAWQQLFNGAKALINQKKYPESRAKFEEFIRRYPKWKLARKAKYYVGETYYLEKKYAQAAKKFADLYQKYPKSEIAPETLLRLGFSLKALKKKKGACGAFQELQDKFPKADAKLLKRAKNEYKKLKCDRL